MVVYLGLCVFAVISYLVGCCLVLLLMFAVLLILMLVGVVNSAVHILVGGVGWFWRDCFAV